MPGPCSSRDTLGLAPQATAVEGLGPSMQRVHKCVFVSSSAIDASELRGLSPGQMAVPVGTVARFELVREAGTFLCEGYFKAGNDNGKLCSAPRS